MAVDGMDGNNGARASTRPPTNRKVVVIPLCIKQQFSTAGASAGRDWLVGPAKLAGVGPYLENIVCQGRGENFTSFFNYKVVAEKAIDGEVWIAFANPVVVNQVSGTSVVGSPYTTLTDFMNDIRFSISVANGSGSAVELGSVTVYAALKFWS